MQRHFEIYVYGASSGAQKLDYNHFLDARDYCLQAFLSIARDMAQGTVRKAARSAKQRVTLQDWLPRPLVGVGLIQAALLSVKKPE